MGSRYFHPTLRLGDIARTEVVEMLDGIAAREAEVEAARSRVDDAARLRRTLALLRAELAGTGADPTAVDAKIAEAAAAATLAVQSYAETELRAAAAVDALKRSLSALGAVSLPDTPVDMERSRLDCRPLAFDSLRLDSGYFSFGSDVRTDNLANVERFIRAMPCGSDGLGREVCSQICDQIERHDICGTLIITADCTHRNVRMFSPLVIDADRAVAAWNALGLHPIDTSDRALVAAAAAESDEGYLPIVSGVVCGSGFVGMAHLSRSESGGAGSLDELARQLDSRLKAGGWLANASGATGVDADILADVRALLAANSVSCHISIVSNGVIPTLKSGEMAASVGSLAERCLGDDELHDDGDAASVDDGARMARRNALLGRIESGRIGSMLEALGKADAAKNRTFDISTLIEALDSYISRAGEPDSSSGVPVSYRITKLRRAEIAAMWLKARSQT